MYKKQLLIAMVATVLSITTVGATEITNITGSNGVYNISPAQINGNVGYRQYDNFKLDNGHVANLIYSGIKNGETRDLSTFINLVNNQVKIDGILNAVKADGSGHAVFITPGGLTVGSSGVLNVGTLSVITPTQTKYNSLFTDGTPSNATLNYADINQINHMRNNTSASNPNNYGGNAPVNIEGYVFTRNGADIRGSQVSVAGGIVNGYKPANGFSANNFDGKVTAAKLFDSLVNTDGISAAANQISTNGSSIVIKSGEGSDNKINVTGRIANLDNGETVLTNHGVQGLMLDRAVVAGNGKVNVYHNLVDDMVYPEQLTMKNGSKVISHKDSLSIASKYNINLESGTALQADKNVEIVAEGYGNKIAINSDILANDRIDIVTDRTFCDLEIAGNLGSSSQVPNTIRVVDKGYNGQGEGKIYFLGNANGKSVSIRSKGMGSDDAESDFLNINGTINAKEGVLIDNDCGGTVINGKINVENGNIAINNSNDFAGVTISDTANIETNNGFIAIKNSGDAAANTGLSINGTVKNNKGDIAINSTSGIVQGSSGKIINKKGNTGIKSNSGIYLNGEIDNNGVLNIKSSGYEGGTEINGTVNNSGNLYITNSTAYYDYEESDYGLKINGTVTNKDGNLYIVSKEHSGSIKTGNDSLIQNTNGNLAIKQGHINDNPPIKKVDLNGTIIHSGSGELAINNYVGDMHVGGEIKTNVNTAVRNRPGSGNLIVDAKITAVDQSEPEFRIQNYAGTGDMTVKGDITHNGRLNILNNSGTLTLDGKITNNGSNRTYAIVRDPNGGNTQRAGGVVVGQNFNAQSTDGMIYVLNKVGTDGFTYKGTAKATNAQAELYNMAGNMTVNGGSFEGKPTIILNKGDKLTVTNAASITGDEVKIVNKGTQKAEVGSNHNKNFKEQLAK